jgi:hypothetical protein
MVNSWPTQYMKFLLLLKSISDFKELTMYNRDYTIADRREMLRVKVKSLAAEARIIRAEEKRVLYRKPRTFRGRTVWAGKPGQLHHELWDHRVNFLRAEARATHVAYGLLRGKTLDQIEPKSKSKPDWERVNAMLKKYGPREGVNIDLLKKAA